MFENQLRAFYNKTFNKTNTATASSVSLLSGFIAEEVQNHLTNYSTPMQFSTTYIFDVVKMEFIKNHSWDKIDVCPTCGEDNDSTEPVDLETLISIANQGVILHD